MTNDNEKQCPTPQMIMNRIKAVYFNYEIERDPSKPFTMADFLPYLERHIRAVGPIPKEQSPSDTLATCKGQYPLEIDVDKEPFKGWIKEIPLRLEILAALKGCSLHIYPPQMSDHGGYQFRLSFQKYDREFSGELFEAEQAARNFLNNLEDKL